MRYLPAATRSGSSLAWPSTARPPPSSRRWAPAGSVATRMRAGSLRSALTRWSTVAISSLLDGRSEEHTSELQSRPHLVCRLLLEKKKNHRPHFHSHTEQTKQNEKTY